MLKQIFALFVLLGSLLPISAYCYAPKPFAPDSFKVLSSQQFDSVVAYEIKPKLEIETIIANKRVSKYDYTKAVKLTVEQSKAIMKTIEDKSTYGESGAACFNPRMAIVFYRGPDAVTDVLICFECNQLYSKTNIPATWSHTHMAGDYKIPDYGFSKKGRAALVKFCVEFGFGDCGIK
ncbi:MAG: hypothetical protein JWO06_128 [Bacteroidota bacterium]|nr:hypothetical protein [Bacteroidota bacterium]